VKENDGFIINSKITIIWFNPEYLENWI